MGQERHQKRRTVWCHPLPAAVCRIHSWAVSQTQARTFRGFLFTAGRSNDVLCPITQSVESVCENVGHGCHVGTPLAFLYVSGEQKPGLRFLLLVKLVWKHTEKSDESQTLAFALTKLATLIVDASVVLTAGSVQAAAAHKNRPVKTDITLRAATQIGDTTSRRVNIG